MKSSATGPRSAVRCSGWTRVSAVYGLTDQGDLVILKLAPDKCEVLATAHVLETTHAAKGRKAVWAHPAFADKHVYLKNDKEIVCISLAG